MKWLALALGVSAIWAAPSCGSSDTSAPGGQAPAQVDRGDPVDQPIDGLTHDWLTSFEHGDALFDTPFAATDGLGPLYVREGCGDCHDRAGRGPGSVQKMSVVLADGVTASPDQSALPFGHSIRPYVTAGAETPVEPPKGDANVRVSTRVGPPVLGRGYLEAIDDAAIERVAAAQAARGDGIHGTINRVTYASQANPDARFHAHRPGDANLIGRFGVKARIATVDDFVADAFQNDMGITSTLRPDELPNPDGRTDDAKPGVDLPDISFVNDLATYLRLLAIPLRRLDDQARGAALFTQIKCNVCHVPSLETRADYPVASLAGIDAPVFTDLLLHDMGPALADGMIDGAGKDTSRQWRTAPLIGVRFSKTFLHDGRADSLATAVTMHDDEGSEAAAAARLFAALAPADRNALLAYVGAL